MSNVLLERVREAFTGSTSSSSSPSSATSSAAGPGRDAPAPAVTRPSAVRAGVVDLFADRVDDDGGTVVRCAPDRVEDCLDRLLGRLPVVVPDGFPYAVPSPLPAGELDLAGLDGARAVVTTATLGVATAGAVVLTHGPGQGPRSLVTVPEHHVCVLHAGQVVLGVPDAVAALDPRAPQTWATGLAGTGDVELDQLVRSRGGRRLTVVLVG